MDPIRRLPAVRSHPFDLVIFDCDGVLVDSERIAVGIDAMVLTRLGWEMSENEIVERFLGLSDESQAQEIEAHLGRALPEGWQSEFDRLYREAYEARLRPVDGVVEALDRIRIPACVASSGTHEKIRFTLGLAGLYERFDGHIFSVADVARGKPAPDVFLFAAERMGADPAGCAVVEDSPFGVQAARSAGMVPFGYAGGLVPAERLAAAGAIVFDEMGALPALLAEGRGR
jgi:HAD superfamily hydrolase (TIGR01509 family)